MPDFEGFREGCPGLLRYTADGSPQVSHYARFQSGGKKLEEWDAGVKRPDGIRVIPVDDYEGPCWQDRVYAFDQDAAEAQIERGDDQVPEGKVFALEPSQLEGLNRACTDCKANGRQCPALAAMMEMVTSREVEF